MPMTHEDILNSKYNGKRLQECTREELLKCVGDIYDDFQRERDNHAQTLRMLDLSMEPSSN
jgi:hypothetical protein